MSQNIARSEAREMGDCTVGKDENERGDGEREKKRGEGGQERCRLASRLARSGPAGLWSARVVVVA